ncbi:hypothetical protein HY024_01105 [Candidatus Curtissbacteria bacterium]|nr:hypothetical protein [Candidatus Curtissbacteria bacterium]
MKAATSSGQILILVLLIVVVALAVGLSVAARNITNLRSSAQTEQSQRAFTTAEGGVEDILSRLSFVAADVASHGGSAPYTVDVGGGLQANIVVKSNSAYQSTIDLGNVGQIDLDPTHPGGAVRGSDIQIKISWGKAGVSGSQATLVVTQYTLSGGVYGQSRKLFTGDAAPVGAESGTPDSKGSCSPDAGFATCAVVTVPPSAILLRIRPFWTSATVSVAVQGAGTIPVQTYDISSTAKTAAGITRKVQVTRTALPQLPAAFDYVLFSSGSIVK